MADLVTFETPLSTFCGAFYLSPRDVCHTGQKVANMHTKRRYITYIYAIECRKSNVAEIAGCHRRSQKIRRINRQDRTLGSQSMRKSAQLSVRVTEQDITRLRELAVRDGILLSELVRRSLSIVAAQPSGSPGFLQRIASAMAAGR